MFATKEMMMKDWYTKKASLTWAMFVAEEMVVKRTLRSVEAGVFELLCREQGRTTGVARCGGGHTNNIQPFPFFLSFNVSFLLI